MKVHLRTQLRLVSCLCRLCRHKCHDSKSITALNTSAEGNNVPVQVSRARGTIILGEKLFTLIKQNVCSKSALFSKAQLAGINGLRRTCDLIPTLGHNVFVDTVGIKASLEERTKTIVIVSTVKCACNVDLNTEAMLVVAIAALTIYDMSKKYNHDVHIRDIEILSMKESKQGGQEQMQVREYDKTPRSKNEPVIVDMI